MSKTSGYSRSYRARRKGNEGRPLGRGTGGAVGRTLQSGGEFKYKDPQDGKTFRARVEARPDGRYVVVRNYRGAEVTGLRISREYPLAKIAANLSRSLGIG